MRIRKSIKKYEYEFDIKAERFLRKHSFLRFFIIFVILPTFVLACVCIITVVISFPIAHLLEYL